MKLSERQKKIVEIVKEHQPLSGEKISELQKEIANLDSRRADSDRLLQEALVQAESKANEQLKPLLDSITQNEAKLLELNEQCSADEKKDLSILKK